jgi:hypothetical protein
MPETFVTITSQVVGNDRSGFKVEHYWDGQSFPVKAQAITNGFRLAESDDFNVGVVKAGRLVSLWWMDKWIGETEVSLGEIGQECGLNPSVSPTRIPT